MNAVASPAVRAPLARPAGAARRGKLYLGTAIAMAAVAFAGFAPSYWAPMAAGTLELHPVVHVHGALFFSWTLYFVAQTALVAGGHARWHRRLGLLGIALAALMVLSGVLVQIANLQEGLRGPRPELARTVAGLGLSAMLMFTTFVALAIANFRRPEIHRRLMVLASFAIIGAAVVRLAGWIGGGALPERVLLGTLVVDGLLVAVVLLDRRAAGRIHPVWIAGGLFLVLNQVLRAVIAGTGPWAAFTDWLAAFGG